MILPTIFKAKAFLFTAGGLLAALAVTLGLLTIQTSRLSSANTSIVSLKSERDLALETAEDRRVALVGRDQTISTQTASIESLAASKGASRVIYRDGIAKADTAAVLNEQAASKLISADPAVGPEGYCEAARSLIEQELLNAR